RRRGSDIEIVKYLDQYIKRTKCYDHLKCSTKQPSIKFYDYKTIALAIYYEYQSSIIYMI
ncbi:5025_t:CDS:1, partial [Gigaspora rosea]